MSNDLAINSMEELKRRTEGLIRNGLPALSIKRQLLPYIEGSTNIDLNLFEKIVDDVCQTYPNYRLIQKIVRSDLVEDINSMEKGYLIVDRKNRNISRVAADKLEKLFSKNFKIYNRVYTAKFEYMPHSTDILLPNEQGEWIFNSYVPPFWYKDFYYSGGKQLIPEVSKMPKQYKKFLMHLVGGDKESFNYIVDWLATALRARNFCILCTIGKKGIGKGVLGDIMREVVGDSNFFLTGNRVLMSTFNSQLMNRKIIYCDEVKISSSKEEDKLKLLINEHLEIEQKGVDAVNVKNYGNVYLSSNNLDSIKITGDNRRFSVVNLTDNSLLESMNKKEIAELTDNKDLVAEFASYLYHKPVDQDKMMKVFVSKRTEEVRLGGLKDWEHWLLFEANYKNGRVSLDEVKDKIIENHGYIKNIGYRAINRLNELFPERIKLVRAKKSSGERVYMVEFTEDKNVKASV